MDNKFKDPYSEAGIYYKQTRGCVAVDKKLSINKPPSQLKSDLI